jgi:hypothetical protein
MNLTDYAGRFFKVMEFRIRTKSSEGWRGWGQISPRRLIARLMDNAGREQWVDVANLAMILWAQKERDEYVRVQAIQKKGIIGNETLRKG